MTRKKQVLVYLESPFFCFESATFLQSSFYLLGEQRKHGTHARTNHLTEYFNILDPQNQEVDGLSVA